jgi:hypothetical protein
VYNLHIKKEAIVYTFYLIFKNLEGELTQDYGKAMLSYCIIWKIKKKGKNKSRPIHVLLIYANNLLNKFSYI